MGRGGPGHLTEEEFHGVRGGGRAGDGHGGVPTGRCAAVGGVVGA